ncbi:hypothetical protein MMC13_006846 [Lambiella insularis]|nr:hypothetical protein [Lambiella insularis]
MAPEAISQDESVPRPDEIIEWMEDQAVKAGMIKWRNYFSIEDSVSDIYLNPNFVQTYREYTVVDGMNEAVREYENEQWIIQKMRKHGDVVKKTETVVEEKLLAAGMNQQQLKQLRSKKASLLVKVAELYKLQNPPSKEPQRVKVSLLWQTETATEMRDYYLSVEETLDNLKPTLERSCATFNGRGERVDNKGRGPWMYQLTERGKGGSQASRHPRVALLQEVDYREFMRKMTKKGSSTPSAIIFQESTIYFQKELAKKKEEEDAEWNILDEDGKIYFQDIDWDMINKREWGSPSVPEKSKAQQMKSDQEPRRSARIKRMPHQLG